MKSLLHTPFFSLLFCCITFFLLPTRLLATSYINNVQEKVEQTLARTDLPAAERFFMLDSIIVAQDNRDTVVLQQLSSIYETTVHDFLQKNKTQTDMELCRAWYWYRLVLFVNPNLQRLALWQKSIELFEPLPVSYRKALVFRNYANFLLKSGDAGTAHAFLLRSIEMFEKLQDRVMASMCYYEMAITYLNTGDTGGVGVQIDSLRSLNNREDNPLIRYNYYSVASAWYAMQLDEDMENTALRDSVIKYGKQSLVVLEEIKNPQTYQIMPVWNYFSVALYHDLYFDPPVTDSIRYYLDKAETVINKKSFSVDEIEPLISIYDLRSWQYMYEKKYTKAEQTMLQVLKWIEYMEKESPNTIISERGEAYRFFEELYERQGKFAKALEYQKLLTENDKKRYDLDKNRALHEVETQYEVEKKQERIARLEEQNATARKMLISIISIAIVCIIAVILLLIIIHLRKKNAEQQLYEAALLADRAQEEVSDRQEEIALLKNQYEKLSALADQNATNAKRYAADLEHIRQQLNNSPTGLIVNRLIENMQQLPEKTPYRQQAISKLQDMDLEQVDKLFATAQQKLSAMDKKYILCFQADIKVEDIASFFCVEPASVYTVRYRIKKKFPSDTFLFA